MVDASTVGTDPVRTFEAGQTLFEAGEAALELLVVQSGSVQVLQRTGELVRAVATLGPGDVLGAEDLVCGRARSVTAVALEPTRCVVADGPALEAMVIESPEIAVRLIYQLAVRLADAQALNGILAHREPGARATLGLARHAQTIGQRTQEGIRIPLKLAQIAAFVAITPEEMRDAARRLASQQVLRADEQGILVADVPRLYELV